MNNEAAIKEIQRLRNRHVAKLLAHLGDVPPFLEIAIKRGLSMFAEDVEANIIHSDYRGDQNGSEPIRR